MKISFKTLGFKASVECNDGEKCSDAIAAFEKLTSKTLENMELYVKGQKVKPEDVKLEDGMEITAIKSKHESA